MAGNGDAPRGDGEQPVVDLHPIRTWSVRCSTCGQVSYGTTEDRAERIKRDHEESHVPYLTRIEPGGSSGA